MALFSGKVSLLLCSCHKMPPFPWKEETEGSCTCCRWLSGHSLTLIRSVSLGLGWRKNKLYFSLQYSCARRETSCLFAISKTLKTAMETLFVHFIWQWAMILCESSITLGSQWQSSSWWMGRLLQKATGQHIVTLFGSKFLQEMCLDVLSVKAKSRGFVFGRMFGGLSVEPHFSLRLSEHSHVDAKLKAAAVKSYCLVKWKSVWFIIKYSLYSYLKFLHRF